MPTKCKPPYCTCGDHILADEPGPPPIDWCYYDDCTKHASPTGPPKRIMPTWTEQLAHADQVAKWRFRHTTPDPDHEVAILELIHTSQTAGEYIGAYRLAELAGMCWWSTQEAEYIWKK